MQISFFPLLLSCIRASYGPIGSQTWIRTTNFAFRLTVSGTGLSSADTLRIIEPGSSCTAESGDVSTAESTMQWNCPDIDSGCSFVRQIPTIDIPVKTIAWNCLDIDTKNACSAVSISVTSLAADSNGEIIITFSAAPPLAQGSYIKFGTGVSCADATCSADFLNLVMGGSTDTVSNAYKMGHPVYRTADDALSVWRISVPQIANETAPAFAVNPAGAEWYRTDEAHTRVELKGLSEKSGMRVCWNGGGKVGGYTAQAGVLDIVDAPLLSPAVMLPMSTAPGISGGSPFLISFTTSNSAQYSSTSGVSELILTVTAPSVFRILNTEGSELSAIPIPSQALCGSIFLEMSSSDSTLGFPYPSGCYVTVATIASVAIGFDVHVLFLAGNGLNKATTYQLSMNMLIDAAVARAASTACCISRTCGTVAQLAEIRACQYLVVRVVPDVTANPYNALETAQLQLTDRLVSSFTRTGSHPFLTSAVIQGGVGNLVNLSAGVPLEVTLTAGDGSTTGSLKAGYYVRLMLFPYTQWRLREVCSASIIHLNPGDVGYTGTIPLCTGELVGGQRSVILMKLPADMPDIFMQTRITIRVTGLSVPSCGFFPTSVGVQVSDTNDRYPFFTRSTEVSAATVYKLPDTGRTRARILKQNSLTESSFKSDTGRDLIIEIMSGISFDSASTLAIQFPAGWTCVSVSSVGVNFFNTYPTGAGAVVGGGTWSPQGSTCTLTLSGTAQVYAQASLFLRVTVNYPASPMGAAAAVPTLSITAGSVSHSQPFYASPTNDPGFVSSVPVLGILTHTHIEPIQLWQPSQLGIVQVGRVALFFKTEQAIPNSGFVRISLPPGFTVPLPCLASHLDDYVYATAGVTDEYVLRLPELQMECSYNSADSQVVVEFKGTILASSRYAVAITVSAPVIAAASNAVTADWAIRTLDSSQSLVDGNQESVPLYEFLPLAGSFGFYQLEIPLTVSIASYTPFSISGSVTLMTLSFNYTGPAIADPQNVRLTLPVGFIIDQSGGPIISSAGTLDWQARLAGGAPSPANVLLFTGVTLGTDQTCTFAVSVRVPDRPPSLAIYKIRLEFGYTQSLLNQRPLIAETATVTSLQEHGIVNGAVLPTSPVGGLEVMLQLKFTTHAEIPLAGGILITIPAGFSFAYSCQVTASFAGVHSCSFPGDGKIHISPQTQKILPAEHTMYVRGINPVTIPLTPAAGSSCGYNMCFGFTTLTDRSDPNTLLEKPLFVPGYDVTDPISAAGIVTLLNRSIPGRNDRPGYRNSVVIYFQPIRAKSKIVFVGPAGLVFDADCLSVFTVATSSVFGGGIPWPSTYSEWPAGLSLESCIGDLNTATVTLSGNLPVIADPYVMRVGIKLNPLAESPVFNQWTVRVGPDQASPPFDSFKLWTFQNPSISGLVRGVRGTSQSVGDNLSMITLSLRPYNSLVNNGTLSISPPAGFLITSESTCSNLHVFSTSGLEWDSATTVCAVSAGSLSISVPGNETLSNSGFSSIVFPVFNPTTAPATPGVWLIQSSASVGGTNNPLDESTVTSFQIVAKPGRFEISNFVSDGLASMKAVTFTVSFDSIDLLTDYWIRIIAPLGFSFKATIGSTACDQIHFFTGPGLFSVSAVTEAQCDNSRSFGIKIKDNIVTRGSVIKFSIPLVNPARSPYPLNFFAVTAVMDQGQEVASGGLAGWPVIPQLEEVSVTLDGALKSPNSLSSISVAFKTVSGCNEFEIEIPSIDFSKSIVDNITAGRSALTPSTTEISLYGHAIILKVSQVIPAITSVNLHIPQVMLGSLPGPVIVHITTRLDSQVADRKVRVSGFSLPGYVNVVGKKITSLENLGAVKVVGPDSALAGYLKTRTDERATLQFNVTTNLSLAIGDTFSLENQGYLFSPGLNASEIRLFTVEDLSTFTTPNFLVHPVGILSISQEPHKVSFTLNTAVAARTELTIEIPAQVPGVITRGESSFYFSIFDHTSGKLSHTNDNSTVGFQIVHQINFTVSASRSPPKSLITTDLRLNDIGLVKVYKVILLAPPGFSVTSPSCLIAGGNLTAASCVPGPVYDGTRVSAVISFTEGITKSHLPSSGLQVGFITPSQFTGGSEWFLLAEGLSDTLVGWGVNVNPISVINMQGVSLSYGQVTGIRTQVAISFENTIRISKGGRLRVFYPPGFIFYCTSFNKVSLPFYVSDGMDVCSVAPTPQDRVESTMTSDLPSFDIRFVSDFLPGLFSFTIEAVTPNEVVETNFALALLDPAMNVVDAIPEVQGPTLLLATAADAVRVQLLPSPSSLKWYPATVIAGLKMGVEIGFTFSQQVNLGSDGLNPVSSILIQFPKSFVSAVEVAGDIAEINTATPILEEVDLTHSDYIRISIDRTQKISQGDYGFRFPVHVPAQLPSINIWYVVVCGGQGLCTTPTDPGVTTSLPIAGFLDGQVHPNTGAEVASIATRKSAAILTLILVFSSLLL